jgi:alpha-amylase
MNKINFLFAVHNHQPVGNFEHVFEEVFQKSYRPYFEVLRKFKSIKTAAHFTGPLLEWLKQHQPDFMKMLTDLVAEGRVEILSGGFYEPLLSILPEEDAIGQIEMMNDFIFQEFKVSPRGLWLAERIWTAELPKIIAKAGIEYTILDDTHFYYAGLDSQEIHGYYITEKQGFPLKIFPIKRELRYKIPFGLPEEAISLLRQAREDQGCSAMTYADDGEKFGSWPETFQWVYEEKWLEKFFTALEANADAIYTPTFSEYLDTHPPTGRVYLPNASYEEMMAWSLNLSMGVKFQQLKETLVERGIPEQDSALFLRGGQWDNFLTKYDESNRLHKKMLWVSRKVQLMMSTHPQYEMARQELYRGQCNCAQWHGLFGGLYLNYLRHALYQHLIAAEKIADNFLNNAGTMVIADYDLDGHDEVIVSNASMTAIIAPSKGGALVELDYKPACFNVSNVLRRREEVYHSKIRSAGNHENNSDEQPKSIHDQVKFKEDNLAEYLFFDRWERHSFQDRMLSMETTLQQFKQSQFEEMGDFIDGQYCYQEQSSETADDHSALPLKLKRAGTVAGQEFLIDKNFKFSREEAKVDVHYRLTNPGENAIQFVWAVEFNFTLLAGDAEDRFYDIPGHNLGDNRMNSEGELERVQSLALCDGWFKFQLQLNFSQPTTLWRFPVETISQSEAGFERTYQGSCLLPHWNVELAPAESQEFRITLKAFEYQPA